MRDDELMHYGRLGMKWGRNIFGKKKSSSSGKRKKKVGKKAVDTTVQKNNQSHNTVKTKTTAVSPKKKTVKEMTNQELQDNINRRRLEQEYARLNPRKVSAGEAAVNKILNDVIIPSATNAARSALQDYATKQLKEALGLNEKQQDDPIKKLKKEVEDMNVRKQKIELDDYFEKLKKNK